jgi:hypothetical protein
LVAGRNGKIGSDAWAEIAHQWVGDGSLNKYGFINNWYPEVYVGLHIEGTPIA